MSDQAVKKFIKRELRKYIEIDGMNKLVRETVVKGKIRSIIVDLDIEQRSNLAQVINFLCNDFKVFKRELSSKEQQVENYSFRHNIVQTKIS